MTLHKEETAVWMEWHREEEVKKSLRGLNDERKLVEEGQEGQIQGVSHEWLEAQYAEIQQELERHPERDLHEQRGYRENLEKRKRMEQGLQVSLPAQARHREELVVNAIFHQQQHDISCELSEQCQEEVLSVEGLVSPEASLSTSAWEGEDNGSIEEGSGAGAWWASSASWEETVTLKRERKRDESRRWARTVSGGLSTHDSKKRKSDHGQNKHDRLWHESNKTARVKPFRFSLVWEGSSEWGSSLLEWASTGKE